MDGYPMEGVEGGGMPYGNGVDGRDDRDRDRRRDRRDGDRRDDDRRDDDRRREHRSSRRDDDGRRREDDGRRRDDEGRRRDDDGRRRDDDRRRDDERRERDRGGDRERRRERSPRDDRDRHRPRERSRDRRGETDDRRRERRDRSRDKERERSPGRDRGRESSRRESPSDGKSRRSVTPIHLKKSKLSNWDVAPKGLENYNAEQVKNMGIFPLPGGASRPTASTPVMIPAGGGLSAPMLLNASLTRQARRLYIGNIPYGCSEETLTGFFNNMITQMGMSIGGPGVPCIAAQINQDKNYAFAEFRSPEEASAAVTFDGVMFQGQSLKVRRPKDYVPPGGVDVPPITAGGGVPGTAESPHRIYVGNLPTYLTDDQVKELLTSFGELRHFSLVKELSGASKGYAFCEFMDPELTDMVCEGLNGLEMGDKKLVVQRASQAADARLVGTGANSAPLGGVLPSIIPQEALRGGLGDPTTVVFLLNMVTPEELMDEQEYQEILEDVSEEVAKFGTVKEVHIPRPRPGADVPGVGKVFIQYSHAEEAEEAIKKLAGRKFADRTIVAGFYPEDRFAAGEF